jgi:hypothetical protein
MLDSVSEADAKYPVTMSDVNDAKFGTVDGPERPCSVALATLLAPLPIYAD